eukprot:TRINITY_DN5047_c0_g1_i5.p1 TRINITY_DN5047_c0_g1~~TRINITY_DN5047_c0_g1_i5.p1  ORF type:complete len:471 (+),score=100.67 TRINITY_DN5047_c0_g1_i5:101-1513(+)
MKGGGVNCDITSGLVDLLSAPDGSASFYNQMVPNTGSSGTPAHYPLYPIGVGSASLSSGAGGEDMTQRMVDHCISYGLTRNSVNKLLERGFRSLQLLSLLPPETIPVKFGDMCDRQRSLLRMCIRALATYSKPEYQVVRALQLLEEKTRNGGQCMKGASSNCPNLSRNEISGAMDLLNNVKKILECPVCYQIFGGPRVWQCSNGHLTCDQCHEHSTTCPLCRSAFSNIRPLAIEELTRQVPLKCKNNSQGCEVTLALRERELHELSCPFTQGHCPVLSCTLQFLIKDTLQHMESQHNLSVDSACLRLHQGVNMSFRSSISMGGNCLGGSASSHGSVGGGLGSTDQQNWWWGPQFVVYESVPFFFVISRRVIEQLDSHQGYFYFWLWVGCNELEARRFLYTLTIESVDGEKLCYTTAPVSLGHSVSSIREQQTCLLLTDSAVKRLAVTQDNGRAFKLQYRIEIIDKHANKI